MHIWKVAWWEPMSHPSGRPDGGGLVPGMDWFEACENARLNWNIPASYAVYAWSLIAGDF